MCTFELVTMSRFQSRWKLFEKGIGMNGRLISLPGTDVRDSEWGDFHRTCGEKNRQIKVDLVNLSLHNRRDFRPIRQESLSHAFSAADFAKIREKQF